MNERTHFEKQQYNVMVCDTEAKAHTLRRSFSSVPIFLDPGRPTAKENAANTGKMDIESVTEIDFSLGRREYTKVNSGLFCLNTLRKMGPYRTRAVGYFLSFLLIRSRHKVSLSPLQ